MKNLHKLGFSLIMFSLLLSCDAFELDGFLDNPNETASGHAEIDLLYNDVMENMGHFLNESSYRTMPYVRMVAMIRGAIYEDQDTPEMLNYLWNILYLDLLPDMDKIIKIAEEKDLNTYAGTIKILKAYTMMTMVDLFGDVPFSEAGKGGEIIYPKTDKGDDVYASCYRLLEEAIEHLSYPVGKPEYDPFYGGNLENWIKAANSLKIRYQVTTKLAGGNVEEIISILQSGKYILDPIEDFDFHYGSHYEKRDEVHPYYKEIYIDKESFWFMSNYYMWSLLASKVTEDPRLRYYFYKSDCDFGISNSFLFNCPTSPYPVHWPTGFPYCHLAFLNDEFKAYYGRDHGDDSRIYPTEFRRVVWGLYPVAGKFDGDDCESLYQNEIEGAGGAGIQPVLHASSIDFLLAEAILTMGLEGDPRMHLENGMKKSITKVMNFAGGSDNMDFEPSQEQIDDYINEVLSQYDAADHEGQLNIIMTEYWLAAFGNGRDVYNNYRRTGMPQNMQPTLSPDPGDFPRSFWYPSNFVNTNTHVTQKSITDRVFWDTHPIPICF